MRYSIISLVPYSPASNGITEQLVGVATSGAHAMLCDTKLLPCFWAKAMSTLMYLQNWTPKMANNGRTPYKLFYGMVPDVSHIRTFSCVVHIALPAETLGKLDE